jgi:hypothetical protein
MEDPTRTFCIGLKYMGNTLRVRRAILPVNVDYVNNLLKVDGKSFEWLEGRRDGMSTCEWFHKVLNLPDNSKVIDYSIHSMFRTGQVALRIECDDFIETGVGDQLPITDAIYVAKGGPNEEVYSLCLCFKKWNGATTSEYVEKMSRPKEEKLKEARHVDDNAISDVPAIKFREFL